MFEFLFNYRPDLFAEGTIRLLASPLRVGLLGIGVALTIWVLVRYGRSARTHERSRPALLLAVRALGVATVVFSLLQPSLSLQAIKPQESFVGVLADTSASMTIADTEQLDLAAPSRAEWLRSALGSGPGEGALHGRTWRALAERFQVRAYSYADGTKQLSFGEPLEFDGLTSDVGRAMETVRGELSGVPLAGVIVFTDGALEQSEALADELLRYRSAGIPLFPVPLGSARFSRDLEIVEVVVDDRSLVGTTVEADVRLSFPGFAGEQVALEVRDEGRTLARETLELPVLGEESTLTKVAFRIDQAGARRLEFRVQALASGGSPERIVQNNVQYVNVTAEEGPHKILYFEGEPRFEYKFIRRAVADDEQLQLVSLLRMADNRFYRQSVDDDQELLGGFPTRREDLFRYRALVIGSVEAGFFSYEQMRMIVDFAAERGGGVLFLGGTSALGEGGYAGTPLAELLPVEIDDRRDVGPRGTTVAVQTTDLGAVHAALQLGASETATSSWSDLPEVLLLNRTGRLKAGAAALLTGRDADRGEDRLVLAQQRFGAGSAVLFTPTDSFRWQMRLELEDQSHEVFWRQLLRWLVTGVPTRLEAQVDGQVMGAGQPVELLATVRDDRFEEDSDAAVVATVSVPGGGQEELDLRWDQQTAGSYRGRFVPSDSGRFEIEVAALGEDSTRTSFSVDVEPSRAEFFGATHQPELLERIAAETGGEVFRADQLEQLIDQLSYSTAGVTVREDRPLWNMPILFFLLLAALLGEWALRRWQGLR